MQHWRAEIKPRYSTDSGERESQPFREELGTHLDFNQHLVLHLDILHVFLRTQHCGHVHNHYWSGVFNLFKFDHTPKKKNQWIILNSM